MPPVFEASAARDFSFNLLFTTLPFSSRNVVTAPFPSGIRIMAGSEGSPIPAMKSGIFNLIASSRALELSPVSSSPSVTRIMALFVLSAPLNARRAVFNASSILVPPTGMEDGASSSRFWRKLVLSMVMGHSRKAVPAKAISPKRSPGLSFTSSRTRYFACSSLLGRTSCAYILLETSKTKRRSLPSPE